MKRFIVFIYTISLSMIAVTQTDKTPWKEMIYASDGFALTLPYPPLPHPDATVPKTTAYTIYLSAKDNHVRLTLRVMHEHRDCDETLRRLKESVAGKSTDADTSPRASSGATSSVKDVSIDGHPGLEYRWNVNRSTTGLERYYCVKGRFYTFSATWPSSSRFPTAVGRVIGSFRLIEPDPRD